MIDWQKFVIATAIFVGVTVLLFYFFPVIEQTNEYDFTTHSFKTKFNYTAIIGIFILFIALAFFMLNKKEDDEIILRTPNEILTEKNQKLQEQLAGFGLTHPLTYRHVNLVGKLNEIGYLYLVEVADRMNDAVFMILVAENNYNRTSLRQKFNSPLISISREFYDIHGVMRYLSPKEKGELVSKLKSLYRELKHEDKDYAKMLLEKATEEEEETE